jgi:hypothetical protein
MDLRFEFDRPEGTTRESEGSVDEIRVERGIMYMVW